MSSSGNPTSAWGADLGAPPLLEASSSLTVGELLPFIQRRIAQQSTYMGVRARKSPEDAWVYQEIIYEIRPTTIVEIGVYDGGSTLMMADWCQLLDVGRVVAVELRPENIHPKVREHSRIEVVEGAACDVFDSVVSRSDFSGPVIVIEDSSHTYANTLAVCEMYAPLVTSESFLIVEDTICHHPLDVGPDPGPYEAATDFVAARDDFIVRRDLESFLLTWNPSGFLQRIKG